MKLPLPTARLDFRRLRVSLAALLLFAWLGAPACSSSNGEAKLIQQACRRNSDCSSPFICSLGSCTTKCKTSADCAGGGSCVSDGKNAICQSAADKNTACDKEDDCPSPLACASDYRCRNLCSTDADCNALDITGRLCATDANGVRYCAEPAEVSGGLLTVENAPGAPTSGVMEPSVAGGANVGGMSSTGGDGGTSGATNADAGGDDGGASGQPGAPIGGTGGQHAAGSGGSGGASGMGGSGGTGPAVCASPCGVGKQCVEGTCAPCGQASGQACCGTLCSPNLVCTDGKCACGGPSQPCCGGSTCSSGIACVSGTCACGGADQACCPTTTGSACKESLACTGAHCTCLVAAHEDIVQRSDGSLWMYLGSGVSAPTQVKRADNSPFIATSFSSAPCGVQSDGSLWCWNPLDTTNTHGYLGNGTTVGTIFPSQVVTGVNGPPLTGITKVFSDPDGYTECAVNASGALWCWGLGNFGILGNGYANDSLFAVPVLTSNGGPQFSGVAQVSITSDHVCAITTQGALYCWGNNISGQIGIGLSGAPVLFPTQVTALFNNVVGVTLGNDIGGGAGGGSTTCAAVADGGAWCWGDNSWGQLGIGTKGGASNVPVQVLTAAGGTPLSSISGVQSLYEGSGMVARRSSDGSLWIWGVPTQVSVPQPYTEGGFPVSGVFSLVESGDYGSPQFIASDGAFHRQGAAVPSPPCP